MKTVLDALEKEALAKELMQVVLKHLEIDDAHTTGGIALNIKNSMTTNNRFARMEIQFEGTLERGK